MIEAANFIFCVDNSRISIEWNNCLCISFLQVFFDTYLPADLRFDFITMLPRWHIFARRSRTLRWTWIEVLKGERVLPHRRKTKTDSLKVRNLPFLRKTKRLHLNTMWSCFRCLLLIDIISFIYRFINRYVFGYLKRFYRDRLNSINLYLTNARKYNRTKLGSASDRIQRN